jgi:hypothetical protein
LLFKTKKKKTLPNARRSAVETLKKTRPIWSWTLQIWQETQKPISGSQ